MAVWPGENLTMPVSACVSLYQPVSVVLVVVLQDCNPITKQCNQS